MSNAALFRIMEKCCIIDGTIWYVNVLLNGLFKVDIQTGKASYVGIVDKKEMYLRKAYSEILYCDGFIYMIPYNAEKIGVYNMSTGQFDHISVIENVDEKFCASILLGKKIYLLPYKAKNFYCLDTRTKKISKINELENIKISIFSAVEEGGNIWFVNDGTHSLYCYQPVKEKLQCINLDETKGCFSSIGRVENKIIAGAIDKATILIMDLQTKEMTYFDFEKYSDVKGKRNYYISEYGGKVALIQVGSNACILVDMHNREIKEKRFLPVSLDLYGKVCQSGLGLVMLPTMKDKVFRFSDGRTIHLDDEEALLDWADENEFQWKDSHPMPDYNIDVLIKMIDYGERGKVEEKGDIYNIYEVLKR